MQYPLPPNYKLKKKNQDLTPQPIEGFFMLLKGDALSLIALHKCKKAENPGLCFRSCVLLSLSPIFWIVKRSCGMFLFLCFCFYFNVMFISKQTIATIVPSWHSCLIHCAFKCLCLCLGVPYGLLVNHLRTQTLTLDGPLSFKGIFHLFCHCFFVIVVDYTLCLEKDCQKGLS